MSPNPEKVRKVRLLFRSRGRTLNVLRMARMYLEKDWII